VLDREEKPYNNSEQRGDMITIHKERAGDAEAIRQVNEEAFGRPEEANLIDALRRRGACLVSLVAVDGERIIGHILFTPITIDGVKPTPDAVGLGPLAVLPSHQRRGTGANLIRIGLEECRKAGQEIAIVLGHPGYYPCFGFQPAHLFGIRCEFDVPEEAFMAMALREGALVGCGGVVRYLPEFRDV
jgi:putative acetyltransferase